MKKKIIILLTLLVPFSLLKAGFYELDVSDKVINFSSYCKQGKITVFVMSQHGCNPCTTAKNFFKQNYNINKNVDVYYCMRTKSIEDLKYFQDRTSTLMWGYVEAYTVSPRIYIFSPTGNPQCIYSGFDKEKVTNVMDGLLESMSYYKNELLSFNNNNNNYIPDCEKHITDNENLKRTFDICRNDNEALEYEKNRLSSNLSSFQKNNEILHKKNEELLKTNDEQQITNSAMNKDLENKKILITKLNNKVQQLTDSIIQINKQTEDSRQVIANYLYNLAKENEMQIETKKVKRKTKSFVINQTKIFYEKSLQLGKNCGIEYDLFKKKYKLID